MEGLIGIYLCMCVIFWLGISNNNRPSLIRINQIILSIHNHTRRTRKHKRLDTNILRRLEKIICSIYIDLKHHRWWYSKGHRAGCMDNSIWLQFGKELLESCQIGNITIVVEGFWIGDAVSSGSEIESRDDGFWVSREEEGDDVMAYESAASYYDDMAKIAIEWVVRSHFGDLLYMLR